MHLRLLTNFSFRHFNPVLRPPLYRRAPQKPHFIDNPLFCGVSLLEVSIRIQYSTCYRCESVSKLRMLGENC